MAQVRSFGSLSLANSNSKEVRPGLTCVEERREPGRIELSRIA